MVPPLPSGRREADQVRIEMQQPLPDLSTGLVKAVTALLFRYSLASN